MPIKNMAENANYQRFHDILEGIVGKNSIHYLHVSFQEMNLGVNTSVPIVKAWFGAPGYVLGPENTIWYGVSFSPWPTDEQIKEGCRMALQYFREQRAKQKQGAEVEAAAQMGQKNGGGGKRQGLC